jgi:hypothetical protein
MHKENKLSSRKLVFVTLVLFVLAGCNAVITKSEKDGKEKNVQISTPLGDLKVRKEIDMKELGLTPYPDAHLLPDEKGSDDSANVNISTPFFALRVTAAKYESSDAPEKIVEFYKKDMARYGRVVPCKGSGGGSKAEDKDDELSLKLDCNDISGDSKSTTLKAGEGQSQHIVVVEPRDKTTKISLVHIRLRGGNTETM